MSDKVSGPNSTGDKIGEFCSSHRFWEQEADSACVSVKGSLNKSFDFWFKEQPATKPVLDMVHYGYSLPLMYMPKPYIKPNHNSALCIEDFVCNAISDLL